MTLRCYRRAWDESRGDQYDSWGRSVWYFEVAEDGYAVRQIEQYEHGPTLKYDATHPEDDYGGLAEKPLDLHEFAAFEITPAHFAAAWNATSP
jgi:hypothetical protein